MKRDRSQQTGKIPLAADSAYEINSRADTTDYRTSLSLPKILEISPGVALDRCTRNRIYDQD